MRAWNGRGGFGDLLFVLFVALPPVIVAWVIATSAVPIPYSDEWELAELLARGHRQELRLQDFWAQHNEHRHFLPKVILTAAAWATGWSRRLEPWLSFACALGALIFILILSRRLIGGVEGRIAAVVSSIAIFSLTQSETWLTGWMIVSTLSGLLLAAMLAALSRGSSPGRVGGSAGLALAASTTAAHGLFTWFAAVPLLISGPDRRMSRRLLLFWFPCAAATTALYFRGLSLSSHIGIDWAILLRPLLLIRFLLHMLGAALTHVEPYCSLLGLFQLYLCVHAGILWWRKREDGKPAVWLGFAIYAVLFAAAASFARAQLGLETARAGRLVTSSLFITVATAHLLAWMGRSGLRWRAVSWLFATTAVVLSAANTIQYQKPFQFAARERQQALACLELWPRFPGIHSCIAPIYPHSPSVIRMVREMETLGIRRFAADSVRQLDRPFAGGMRRTGSEQDQTVIRGWARVPADALVLLSRDSGATFIAAGTADIGQRDEGIRPWSIQLEQAVPLDELSAWVYLPEANELAPLSSSQARRGSR